MKKIKSDLNICPFCGKLIGWSVANDVFFSNIFYYKCKNCGGEISINKNSSLDPENMFDQRNVFTIENTGKFNFSKSMPTENLTVKQLRERADKAAAEVETIKQNKEKILKPLINEQGEIIATPKSVVKTYKRKRFLWMLFVILIAVIGVVIINLI